MLNQERSPTLLSPELREIREQREREIRVQQIVTPRNESFKKDKKQDSQIPLSPKRETPLTPKKS